MHASPRASGIVLTSLPPLVVTLFLMIGAPSVIRAQTEIPRPEIPAGLRVKLLLSSGMTITGRAGESSQSELELFRSSAAGILVEEVLWVDVESIWGRSGGSAGRGVLLGAGLGLATSIVMVNNQCSQLSHPASNCTTGDQAQIRYWLYTLSGAGLGALAGSLVTRWTSIPLR